MARLIGKFKSKYCPFASQLANIFQGRIEAPSRLFSLYSMRPRKIFALLHDPEEDAFIGICLGVC